MGDNPSGLPNSWLQKVINFYIKSEGLGDDNLLSKFIPKIHYAMSIPIFATICQEFIGIFVKLKQGQFILAEFVVQLQQGVLMCLVLIGIYTLAYKRLVLVNCIRDLTLQLHCHSQVDGTLLWLKHLPVFNFLVLGFTISCFLIVFLTSVLYPSVRFILHPEKLTFVVFPNWYPVDIVPFSKWFWVAFVYEFVVYWYTAHILAGTCILFLYVEAATIVRFDSLAPYFQQILLCSHQGCYKSKQLETTFSSKNDDRSPALSNTITHAETNGYLYTEKLIKGIEDWNTLKRQTKLINNTFVEYISACHCAGTLINVVMAYATTIELQHIQDETLRVVTGCSLYLSFFFAATSFLYIVSYYVTLIQQSNDKLRTSLWESSWATKNTLTRKLLFHYTTALNRSLVMNVYSFYPINLESFNQDMSRFLSYFYFLYQLTATRIK